MDVFGDGLLTDGNNRNALILLSEEEEEEALVRNGDPWSVSAGFKQLYPEAQEHSSPAHLPALIASTQSQPQNQHQPHQQEQQQQQEQQEQEQPCDVQQRQHQGGGQYRQEERGVEPQQEHQQHKRHKHRGRRHGHQQEGEEEEEQGLEEETRAAMLELQAARLPKPWSADEINPVCLPPAATAWLLPPSFTTSTKDAAEAIEAAASLTNRSAVTGEHKIIDLRKLSRQQLEAASYKHNAARNIDDPCTEAMEGIRERVGVLHPSCEVYPTTIGGNPKVNEYSRAWNMLLRGKGVVPSAAAAAAAAAAASAAKAKPSTEDKKPMARPPPRDTARANFSAYGEYSHEQRSFNVLLAAYLDVPQPLVLPLLSLGGPVCDMKALFLKVAKDCGGWVAACRANKWPDIAQELQRGSQHGGMLKEIYAYYLLPVEVGMARSSMRPASVNQWLESKVTERRNAGSEESRRPTPSTVSQAVQAADEGMQAWARDCANSSAMPYLAHELILQVARDPYGCCSSSALAATLQRIVRTAHSRADVADLAARAGQLGCMEGIEGGRSGAGGLGWVEGGGGRGGGDSSEDDGSGAFVGRGRKRGRGASGDFASQQAQQEQQQQAQAQRQRRRLEQDGSWLEKEQRLLEQPEGEVALKVDALLSLARSLRQKDTRPPAFGAAPPDVMSHFKTQFELVKGFPFRSTEAQPPKAPPVTRHSQAAILAQRHGSPQPSSHKTPHHTASTVLKQQPSPPAPKLRHAAAAGAVAGKGQPSPAAGKPSRSTPTEDQEPPSSKRVRGVVKTPKCGTCHTCLNPSMKKACLTNRERMASGLEPIIGNVK